MYDNLFHGLANWPARCDFTTDCMAPEKESGLLSYIAELVQMSPLPLMHVLVSSTFEMPPKLGSVSFLFMYGTYSVHAN